MAVVAGLAVCCVLAVLGLGYCAHHPVCPIRATSPFSDVSPSFQSAKLTFNSSPDQDKSERRVSKFGFMSDIGQISKQWDKMTDDLPGVVLLVVSVSY